MLDLRETLYYIGNTIKIILLPFIHGFQHKINCNKKSSEYLKCNCRSYETTATEKLRNNMIRSKLNLIEKARLNFEGKEQISFITLTFKQNINDVIEANKYFKKWIQKLQYRYGSDFKYVRVYEYQRRGAIHYHLIIDRYLELAIPYWLKVVGDNSTKGQKNILIKKGTEKNVVTYLSKYITKTFGIKENNTFILKGQGKYDMNLKSYQFSRNCENVIKETRRISLTPLEHIKLINQYINHPSQEFYKSNQNLNYPYFKVCLLVNGMTSEEYNQSCKFDKKSIKEYQKFTQISAMRC